MLKIQELQHGMRRVLLGEILIYSVCSLFIIFEVIFLLCHSSFVGPYFMCDQVLYMSHNSSRHVTLFSDIFSLCWNLVSLLGLKLLSSDITFLLLMPAMTNFKSFKNYLPFHQPTIYFIVLVTFEIYHLFVSWMVLYLPIFLWFIKICCFPLGTRSHIFLDLN